MAGLSGGVFYPFTERVVWNHTNYADWDVGHFFPQKEAGWLNGIQFGASIKPNAPLYPHYNDYVFPTTTGPAFYLVSPYGAPPNSPIHHGDWVTVEPYGQASEGVLARVV